MEASFHRHQFEQQTPVIQRPDAYQKTSVETSSLKRPRVQTPSDTSLAGTPKRIKTEPEKPSFYSENVRKKLQATSRTGQACDRCKERKMKCDTNPEACQPCRSKNLKCYTTDRVSGKPRLRGDQGLGDGELAMLTSRLAAYEQRYGPLPNDGSTLVSSASPAGDMKSSLSIQQQHERRRSTSKNIPSETYVGWPLPKVEDMGHRGPVYGTCAIIPDWGVIDCSDFRSELMDELPESDPKFDPFTFAPASCMRTMNQKQRISEEEIRAILPNKERALEITDVYLSVTWNFVPITHRDSFRRVVNQYYDSRKDVSRLEELQVLLMLATLYHQFAIRNPGSDRDKIQHAYKFYHYCLGFYPDLMQDKTLPSMQALALILVLMRNLPKPGCAWIISQEMLMKCLDLDYHRDPDKVDIPLSERNVLSKELRKRVFHSIYGIAVTTGHRLGKPSPWQNLQWDVPLPTALQDSELSIDGIQEPRSGKCDFWGCLQLAKFLPISTEAYDHIMTARKTPEDYLATVSAIHQKVDAWRADWDESIKHEDKDDYAVVISTLLIDSWHAEALCNLYHPAVCTAPDRMDKHLSQGYKAAKRLLTNYHILSNNYKAADFTWHSTVAYTLGFGLTLYFHKRNCNGMAQNEFKIVQNELNGWAHLIAYADLVCGTGGVWTTKFKNLKDDLVRYIQNANPQLTLPNTTRSQSISNGTSGMVKEDVEIPQQYSPSLINYEQTTQNYRPPVIYHTNHMPQQAYSTQQYEIQSMTFQGYPVPGPNYPNLPTSLAPLLNDQPPGNIPQFSDPAMYTPDPTGMFAPQLYTGQHAAWPVLPQGGSYS